MNDFISDIAESHHYDMNLVTRRFASKILNSTIETRTEKRDIQIYVFDKKAIIQRVGNCLYSLFPIRPSNNLLSDDDRTGDIYLWTFLASK